MEIEKISSSVVSAIDEFLYEHNLTFSEIDYKVIQYPSRGFFGLGKKPAKVCFTINRKYNDNDEINLKNNDEISFTENINLFEETKKNINKDAPIIIKNFLNELFKSMGLNIDVKVDFINDKNIDVNLEGENIGVIIGKRGKTLYSLQYITNLIVNKGNYDYIKINIDTFGYLKKRKESLENFAEKIKEKVKLNKKTIKLEPMNSYERKIIHNFLKDDKEIKSFSEGEEPYRYVVIIPKK